MGETAHFYDVFNDQNGNIPPPTVVCGGFRPLADDIFTGLPPPRPMPLNDGKEETKEEATTTQRTNSPQPQQPNNNAEHDNVVDEDDTAQNNTNNKNAQTTAPTRPGEKANASWLADAEDSFEDSRDEIKKKQKHQQRPPTDSPLVIELQPNERRERETPAVMKQQDNEDNEGDCEGGKGILRANQSAVGVSSPPSTPLLPLVAPSSAHN